MVLGAMPTYLVEGEIIHPEVFQYFNILLQNELKFFQKKYMPRGELHIEETLRA